MQCTPLTNSLETAPSAPEITTRGASFCEIAKPIYWHPHDTGNTVIQVKIHNQVGKELCGWGRTTPVVVP